MTTRGTAPVKHIDWLTFFLYLSLSVIGWLMINAAESSSDPNTTGFSFNDGAGKQLLLLVVSLVVFWIFFFIDFKFWNTFAYIIFALTLALLVLVLPFGDKIKGATSWFNLFGFSLQPSEFAKMGTCLALASYLSYHKTKLRNRKHIFVSIGIILLPAVLIILQPDPGSALVYLSFFLVLYREGLTHWIYVIAGIFITLFILSLIYTVGSVFVLILAVSSAIYLLQEKRHWAWWITYAALSITSVIGLGLGWQQELIGAHAIFLMTLLILAFRKARFRILILGIPSILICLGFSYMSRFMFDRVLEPHQQDRINVWLRPELSDPRGSMYNLSQSKLAISSGGFQGKGYLKGTLTKLNYVPEQSTDFIFSTIGEEQGFLGSFGIIAMFLILLVRITMIGERAKSSFTRTYAYGLAGILFIHFFINIGMTMGLVPVIGIPLPFISKGGSSLLAFSMMMAILLKLDMARYAY